MLASDNTETIHLVHGQTDLLPGWGQGSPRVAAVSVLGMLPAMDDAILLLQVLLASPVVNLQAVADVVRNDVGLTIELLKIVCRENGGDREIETSVTGNVVHAYRSTNVDPEAAYVAGLLFRIGELPAIMQKDWNGADLAPRETARLLAKTWRLPRLLEDVVYGDEVHAASESLPLLELVEAADEQARRIHGLAGNFARGVF
jgi:HD-like signal output (HDOD) protein